MHGSPKDLQRAGRRPLVRLVRRSRDTLVVQRAMAVSMLTDANAAACIARRTGGRALVGSITAASISRCLHGRCLLFANSDKSNGLRLYKCCVRKCRNYYTQMIYEKVLGNACTLLVDRRLTAIWRWPAKKVRRYQVTGTVTGRYDKLIFFEVEMLSPPQLKLLIRQPAITW